MSIVIGTFKPSKDGGWDGHIQTLTIDRKVRLLPNDNRVGTDTPDFRLQLGWQRIGDAWLEMSETKPPREVIRLMFDDPSFAHVRRATLWLNGEGASAQLMWDRRFQ